MGRPFLITGLPRSRTAWFSMLASTAQGIFCYHEPTAGLQSFDALAKLWANPRFENVGVADSTLGFQLERILRDIQPRTLVVERPIGEVRESLLAYMSGIAISVPAIDSYLEALQSSIEACLPHPLVHRITYQDLQDRTELYAALDWVMPGTHFENLDNLMHMNVQIDRDYVLAQAARPHTHWYRKGLAA